MLSLQSATQRIIAYMLGAAGAGSWDLAGATGTSTAPEATSASVQLPALKQVLASRLGMTPETFSRAMRSLTAEGLIQVNGSVVEIPDVSALDAHARPAHRRRGAQRGRHGDGAEGRGVGGDAGRAVDGHRPTVVHGLRLRPGVPVDIGRRGGRRRQVGGLGRSGQHGRERGREAAGKNTKIPASPLMVATNHSHSILGYAHATHRFIGLHG